MKQREDTERPAQPLEAHETARKPYKKPAVRHEQVFETRAMSCGKTSTIIGCTRSHSVSNS